MNRKWLAACLAMFAGSAGAELLNISAGGLHSNTVSQIACTIASSTAPTFQGFYAVIVLAEGRSEGSNPKLTLRSLTMNNLEAYNLNWQEPTYGPNGATTATPEQLASIYDGLLRRPGSPQDAAMLYLMAPGEAICAFTNEEGARTANVAVSITDVTARILQGQSAGPSNALARALGALPLAGSRLAR